MGTGVLADLELVEAIAAVVVVLLTLVWLVVMVRFPPSAGDGGARLACYAEPRGLLVLEFLPAALLALCCVPVWTGLGVHLRTARPAAGGLSVVSGILHVPPALVGYSQPFTVARAMAGATPADRERVLPVWRVVAFSGAPESAAGWMVVLG
jgi:hypothetical protein